jgi:hypothetical protein
MAEQSVPQAVHACRPICPFWLEEDQCCSMFEEGIFLPGTEHIRIFCKHANYPSCTHYVDSARLDSTGDAGKNRSDKRRFERLPARFSLHLLEPAFDGLERVVDDTALTVDISEVGLRFETRTPMQIGASLYFTLWQEPPSPLLHGSGRIKWCHSLENAPLYHAGISFTDETIARAVRTQLDLP